jgi:hypothetical protein
LRPINLYQCRRVIWHTWRSLFWLMYRPVDSSTCCKYVALDAQIASSVARFFLLLLYSGVLGSARLSLSPIPTRFPLEGPWSGDSRKFPPHINILNFVQNSASDATTPSRKKIQLYTSATFLLVTRRDRAEQSREENVKKQNCEEAFREIETPDDLSSE